MKELLKLKSFQKVMFYMFLTGIVLGTFYGIHIFTNNLRFYSIMPFLPVIYIIVKGFYKNTPLLIEDFKSIYLKL